MKQTIQIEYEILDAAAVPAAVRELINQAEQALLNSHAPYSNFHVGAALLLDDGTIIRGSNQENAAFPIGFCAERTALAARFAQAPDRKIEALAIAVMNKAGSILPPIAPCGMCRQALLEEEQRQDGSIRVYLSGNDDRVMVFESVSSLLPFQFNSSFFLDTDAS